MSNSANSFYSGIRRALLGALTVLVLVGCAGKDTHDGDARSPVENQLIAEIAIQRGEFLVAVEEYQQLAQKSSDPEHARRATELAYEFGYDVYALEAAERWVELAPEEQLAHAYLGRMYVRSNQLDRAFDSLNLGMGPVAERVDNDYLMLSVELASSVAAGRALLVLERFAESDPPNPGISAGIATLAGEAGRYEQAIEASRQTIQQAPDWGIARISLAQYLLANGQPTAAFEQMAYALEMSPGPEMELEFIRLLAAAGQERDARDRMERLIARYPDNPNLIRVRAALALERGDLEAARSDYIYLLSEAYYLNEVIWHMGDLAMRGEEYGQAIRYFSRIGAGNWQRPAKNSLSKAYMALGDGGTALAVQREFAANYPKEAMATLPTQAEILVTMDRLPEALAVMDVAIGYRPWDERLWLFRGGLFEQAGQRAAAIDSFRTAYELAPYSAVVKNALGYTLLNVGTDYAEALGLIQEAVAAEPRNPAYLDSLGWAWYRLGDLQAALEQLEAAYRQLSDGEIAAHLGEVLWETGRSDVAKAIWAEAIAREPDNRILLETMRRYMP